MRAGEYQFGLLSSDERVLDGLTHLLAVLQCAESDVSDQWRIERVLVDGESRWRFSVNAEEVLDAASLDSAVLALVQRLNTEFVRSWPGPVCHAGGVSYQGLGVVLPADPESGKSTLTCGLVRAGSAYLTDEGVAFRPGTLRIEPYPKPITLDRGSWFLFPELEPEPFGESERDQWQVSPLSIRPDAVSGPCDARYIVFPKYVEGADTRLTPIRRAEALVDLAKNTFEFNQHSREYLDQLAIVVEACDCYRLTVGTLEDAVSCIQELVGAG